MEGGGTMGDVAMPWASVLDRTDGQGGDLLGDVIGLPGGRMEEPGDRSSMKRGQDAMAERGESQQQLQVSCCALFFGAYCHHVAPWVPGLLSGHHYQAGAGTHF